MARRLVVKVFPCSVSAGRIDGHSRCQMAQESRTLLRALNGGIKPCSGEEFSWTVSLCEVQPPRRIGQSIAVVAQEGDVGFPVTVFEYVLGGRYALVRRGWLGMGIRTRFEDGAERYCAETELENLPAV